MTTGHQLFGGDAAGFDEAFDPLLDVQQRLKAGL
jgi:hypothetical protein